MAKWCSNILCSKSTNPTGFMIFALLLYLHLKAHVTLATDVITADQSLSGDQTIVSAGGKFELGFFKPGNSSNHYIGLWYYMQLVSVQTVVWVANREQPVLDRFSSELRISDGNLVLFNESNIPIWSTNISSTTSGSTELEAVLLDNGNLVLRAESSSSQPSWQSFDDPSHTWLPGSKLGINNITKQALMLTSWKNSENPSPGQFSIELDPNGTNAYIMMWNGSKQYWTTGQWDEQTKIFSLIPQLKMNVIYNYSYVTNENGSYLTYTPYDPNIIFRFVLNVWGHMQQLTWSETSKQWQLYWSFPERQCQVYGLCGPFSMCNQDTAPDPFCKCLMGFEPKSDSHWDMQDYSEGCSRKTRLQCGNVTSVKVKNDKFVQMPSMETSAYKKIQNVNSIGDCGSICLNDCNCSAYGYTSSVSECSTWNGDLLADASGQTLNIRIAASDYKNLKSRKQTVVIATVSTTAGLLTTIVGYFLWAKSVRKRRKMETTRNLTAGDGQNDTELPLFSLKSVLAATNNFSESNKLGEGGFGPVYKGILQENQVVAIKRLSKKSGQGRQEFINELKLIAKLQHTNLVRLMGCCIEDEEMMLIYEYMPNRSLDKILFDPSEQTKLDWDRRFKIIEGIAQGLLYIHRYSRLRVIHRDLKASNILLDGTMNPKISDFGMAKIFHLNQTEANTNRVVGTYGYMSPEYARYGHFSEKSDVFSFGVLLLEIISGKKNASFYRFEQSPTLAEWAWDLWKEGRGMKVIDPSIKEPFRAEEALRCIHVGLLCVQESAADRPAMDSVIHMLQGNEATSIPPSKEPAFSTQYVATASSSQSSAVYSNNPLTISLPEAR